jgi:hypothetical protein
MQAQFYSREFVTRKEVLSDMQVKRVIVTLTICSLLNGCVTLDMFIKNEVVEGRVVDAITGGGVKNVEITIKTDKGEKIGFIVTGEHGEFEVQGLKKQKYKFICKKRCVVQERIKIVDLTRMKKDDLVLTIPLTVGAAVKGRIMEGDETGTSTGKPASGAEVKLLTEENVLIKEEHTTPTGEFLFSYVEVDKCRLRIRYSLPYFPVETEIITLEKGKVMSVGDIVLPKIPEELKGKEPKEGWKPVKIFVVETGRAE